jgi:hypothetical protein
MNNLVAWFTVDSKLAVVTDEDDNGLVIDTIPLTNAFFDDEWNPELAMFFIHDTLTAHYGIGRWTNAGEPFRDDEFGTVGIDFDLNP